MNVAPSSITPRAARRTSCLGTFVLVVVLWSVSVVALAAYLVTRSAIVRQVRVAWWAVFLGAAALLGIEIAIFEATGDGLVDLLRLHIHPWCPGSSADVVSGTGSYVGSRASKITRGHHLHLRA